MENIFRGEKQPSYIIPRCLAVFIWKAMATPFLFAPEYDTHVLTMCDQE